MTPEKASRHFPTVGRVDTATPLRLGHIHDSWVVANAAGRWVIQRCNETVFADLDAVMANMTLLCSECFPELSPVVAETGAHVWRDNDGAAWRALPFVGGTVPTDTSDRSQLRSLGAGLGAWHRRVADFDPNRLAVTIPRFHDPAARLDALAAAVRLDIAGRAAAASPELEAIDASRWLAVEAQRMRAPTVPARVAHFDAKADNMLLDALTGRVRAVVDLDTVMAGSWLWDVGDLVRSSGGPDDAGQPFDPTGFAALLDGYTSEAGDLLTAAEREGLTMAPLVATFEQAVRFLTDHLAGDVYYRVDRPGHNLERCRSQLILLDSMVAHRSVMIRGQ